MRKLAWLVVLVIAAGCVWIYSDVNGDTTTKIAITVVLGIVWTLIVVAVTSVVAMILGLGNFLFRGK